MAKTMAKPPAPMGKKPRMVEGQVVTKATLPLKKACKPGKGH